MSFKRTSEGRVFFKGSETANDLRTPPLTAQPAAQQAQPQMQVQILSLLKALNERLKVTQAERDHMRTELGNYRAMIQELETKTARGEKAYEELARKLAQREQAVAGVQPAAQRAEQIAQETMKELAETRRLLLQLEEKTEQADRDVGDLKHKISQTEVINTELARRQQEFQREQKAHEEKINAGVKSYGRLIERIGKTEEGQKDLQLKLEEAAATQEKMLRRIDQAVEDRARFMRKIERIEETVLQTRDALNAKAMVLLTDQAVSGTGAYGFDDPADMPALAAETRMPPQFVQQQERPWWQRGVQLQATGMAALLVGGVLAGWVVSELQKPRLPSFEDFETGVEFPADEASAQNIPSQQNDFAELESPAEGVWQDEVDTQVTDPSSFEDMTDTAANEAAADNRIEDPAEAAAVFDTTANPLENDIGAVDLTDESAVLALLQGNPDALAAQLNAIEPGALSADNPAAEAANETRIASLPQAETQEAQPQPQRTDVREPAPAPLRTGPVSKSELQPDSTLPEMIKQIELQAYDGVPEAQHDLAAIYTAGHAGVKQNYERAAFWFEKAASQGVANARYNLGVLYHQGLGVPADMTRAIYWYTQAAQLGHPEAQYNLGIAYIEGIGVAYNPDRAAAYFENAAAQGVMEAAYNLGLIYENGLLGKPQPEEALMWYKTAADQGSPEAKSALEQLAKALKIKIEDVNKIAAGMKSLKTGQKAPAQATPKKAEQESSRPSQARQASAALNDAQASTQGDLQDVTAQVQDYLMRVGMYPGPADGVNGPLTQDAIRSYQALNGLEADGRPSRQLLSHMLTNYRDDMAIDRDIEDAALDGMAYDGAPGDMGSRAE